MNFLNVDISELANCVDRPRNSLAYNEHVELGSKLKAARAAIQGAFILMSNRYGKSKKITKAAKKALNAIEVFRCLLDSQSCKDVPLQWSANLYYGKSPEKAQ